jgi:2,4-dienoyl-CoA reductase-like NADH-dependent reductase (Old Yellow Enzyme family)
VPSRRSGICKVYLLQDVERFLNNKNVSAARFGRDAMGDPRFVFDLRRGREPRRKTVQRVKAYLETEK